MPDPACGSCQWFTIDQYDDGPMDDDYEQLEPGRWGHCEFITHLAQRSRHPQHSPRAYPADASNYDAHLIVRDDFACIEHQAPPIPTEGDPR